MALDKNLIEEMAVAGRKIYLAEKDDPRLGPLRWLPGTWKNTSELQGQMRRCTNLTATRTSSLVRAQFPQRAGLLEAA